MNKKLFSQYSNETLQLVQQSVWKRVYELRTPDFILMTMSFPKLFSSLSVVEGFGVKWEIYRPRWWSRTFEVRIAGTQQPFAKFAGRIFGGGGIFELPMGERIHYRIHFWSRVQELIGENSQRLVLFKRKMSFKPNVNIIIENPASVLDRHPWMIMVVYRIMLEQRRNSAAG